MGWICTESPCCRNFCIVWRKLKICAGFACCITYPDWITDELLEVMAEEDKIVESLDIPLQHCDQKVLREMNRRGDRQSITALMRKNSGESAWYCATDYADHRIPRRDGGAI